MEDRPMRYADQVPLLWIKHMAVAAGAKVEGAE